MFIAAVATINAKRLFYKASTSCKCD